jgi:hypothetical protein
MKISEPPYFGVSSATAGVAAPSIAANVAALNATLASRYLFIEPERCQVLIEIMTSQARCQPTSAAGPGPGGGQLGDPAIGQVRLALGRQGRLQLEEVGPRERAGLSRRDR